MAQERHRDNNPVLLIYCPFPTADIAQEITTGIIQKKLASCAHILPPITSLYLWGEEGDTESLQTEQEIPVIFKLSEKQHEACIAFIEDHHPYNCPAIIQVDAKANPAFEAWINRSSLEVL